MQFLCNGALHFCALCFKSTGSVYFRKFIQNKGCFRRGSAWQNSSALITKSTWTRAILI